MPQVFEKFNLVSINYSSFQIHYLDSLFFNNFLSQGFNILYIDCSFIHSTSAANTVSDTKLTPIYQSLHASLWSISCDSYAHLSRILEDLPANAILNLQISWEWRYRRLFTTVRNTSRPSFYLSTGNIPVQKNLIQTYANFLYKHLYRAKQYLLKQVYPSTPSVIVGSGSIARQYYPFIQQVQCPDFLYSCKLHPTTLPNLPENYILYIDQGAPFHPDFKTTHADTCYDPVLWHQLLTSFLGLVEEHFSTRVVIALHPSCSYPPSYYENFLCVSGRSHDLINTCSSVIAHSSTLIGLAIRLYKPILLLSHSPSDKVGVYLSHEVKPFAEVLDCPTYNLGSGDPIPTPAVDYSSYSAYIDKYLYSAGANSPPPEQIISYLFTQLLNNP